MVNFFGLIALFIVCFLYVNWDYRLWGIKTTPGVLLIFGYTFILCVYAIVSNFYQVRPIRFFTFILVAMFAFMSMFVSSIICYLVSWRKWMRQLPETQKSWPGIILLLTITAYSAIAIPIALNNGGLLSGDSKELLGAGFVSHLHIFLSFFLIYYAAVVKNSKLFRPIILLLATFVLCIYPVKGWILFPIFSIALSKSENKQDKSASILQFIFIGIVAIILFFSIYLSRQLLYDFSGDAVIGQFEWITRHFVYYLIGGVIGLDAVLNGVVLKGGIDVICAPFLNVNSYLSGDPYINIVSDIHIPVFNDSDAATNVYSMLGSLIGHCGFYMGIFISLVLIGGGYFLFALSFRLRSFSLYVGALYINSIFAFAWFDYYLWLLTPYEIILFSFIGFAVERFYLTVFQTWKRLTPRAAIYPKVTWR